MNWPIERNRTLTNLKIIGQSTQSSVFVNLVLKINDKFFGGSSYFGRTRVLRVFETT